MARTQRLTGGPCTKDDRPDARLPLDETATHSPSTPIHRLGWPRLLTGGIKVAQTECKTDLPAPKGRVHETGIWSTQRCAPHTRVACDLRRGSRSVSACFKQLLDALARRDFQMEDKNPHGTAEIERPRCFCEDGHDLTARWFRWIDIVWFWKDAPERHLYRGTRPPPNVASQGIITGDVIRAGVRVGVSSPGTPAPSSRRDSRNQRFGGLHDSVEHAYHGPDGKHRPRCLPSAPAWRA
jgi:hypothetical protein